MSSQYFLSQRRQGKVGQEIAAVKLRNKGFTVDLVKDGMFPDYDAIAYRDSIKFMLEIKYDKMAKDTGNVCLDIQSLKKSKATILAYVIDDPGPKVFIMPLNEALAYAEKYPVKKQVGEWKEPNAIVPKHVFFAQGFVQELQ